MSEYCRPASRDEYRIAVICALRVESDAVEALFDEDWEEEHKHPKYPKMINDDNAYTMGRIGEHNVVLAFLPGIGKANSAKLTTSLEIAFPKIKLGLVTGICGGTPFIREDRRGPRDIDVFLGDIIISTELLQYDLGHHFSNEFMRTDTLQSTLPRPNPEIRSFLHKIQGKKGRRRLQTKTRNYLTDILQVEDFENSKYQGVEKDILYNSDYLHKHRESTACNCAQSEESACREARRELTCEDLKCSSGESVLRRTRLKKVEDSATNLANASNEGTKAPSPLVHFGAVASGDSVVKSAIYRDKLAEKDEVIGFEMEGAGAWDSIPIVVIKGVVDYADSHKSYLWQEYGAACGAACMKAFLSEWAVEETVPLGASWSANSLPQRQPGASSPVTREKSETRYEPESLSKQVEDNVNKAYALIQTRTKRSASRKDAREILLKAEAEKIDMNVSLRRRINWALMTVEKDLSCYKYETVERMRHIERAQGYGIKVEKEASQSCDVSLIAQVRLELYIIEGLKALLEFEGDKDADKLDRLKSKAKGGIVASLERLQEVDRRSYDKVSAAAVEWCKIFSR